VTTTENRVRAVRKMKAGVYKVTPPTLDARGRPIVLGAGEVWVVPLSGIRHLETCPHAVVVGLCSPRAIQVEWRGLAIGEPTWADPVNLVIVAKPKWAV
jgi:hypothetical protein